MLADSVLQTLGRSIHVPTIAVTHVFIYDIILLKSGKNSFCIAGKSRLVKETTRYWTDPKQLVKADFIFLSNFREFSPIQSKVIYKQDVPCRSILSMFGCVQHKLAKFLTALLQLVLELYSINCINDS